jgi:hypothetical protein
MFIKNEHNKIVNTMNREKINIEEEILKRAIEALKKTIPAQPEIEILRPPTKNMAGFQPDEVLRVVLNGKELKYCTAIKTGITKPLGVLLLAHRENLPFPLLLVTKYVNPVQAEELRQSGMEFIDTAGNTFINQLPIYVFVKGNRPPEIAGQVPLRRAFRPAGLRMIYGFLCNPGLEKKTYREIAAATGVALGTVDLIIKELKRMGFLIDMGKRDLKLKQKETLFERWVTAYPENLRPRQLLGRYRGQQDWWQHNKLNPHAAQWGGEVAAARLTRYLKPELITIYTTRHHLNELLLENRLRTDIAGDVEILERFWNRGEPQEINEDLVHPILVYADLLATGNQRNLETARMIYEQHVLRFIRED